MTTSTTSPGIWRWSELVTPVDPAHHISRGEANTPLIDLSAAFTHHLNGARLFLKAEYLNPTGSFKDRVAAMAVAIALDRGHHGIIGTSSGNGGAALAVYAAAAGLPALVLTLPDAPAGKLAHILAAGAHVQPVRGLGADAHSTLRTVQSVLETASEHHWLPFLTGARFAPDIMSGAETIAFEIDAALPEVTHVYAPVGGGGLVSSLYRGFSKTRARPRVRAVQPAGCPTVRQALEGASEADLPPARTTVSGLQVSILFDDVVTVVSAPGNALIEIDDVQTTAVQRSLASAGVLVERAGAAALAGAIHDSASLGPGDSVVVIGTGAGWKTFSDYAKVGHHLPAPREASDLPAVLAGIPILKGHE